MKCVNLSVLSPGAGVRYAHMSTRRYGNKQEREARQGKARRGPVDHEGEVITIVPTCMT